MTYKPTYFKIANPCSEQWAEMTPTEKGRFCDKCEKVVHDYTRTDLIEIAKDYVAQKGKICGKLTAAQMNRPIWQPKMNFLRKFALACAMAFGSTLFAMDPAVDPVLQELKTSLSAPDTVTKDTLRITGTVYDGVTGETLPYAAVILQGTATGAPTDLDGNFVLDLAANRFDANDTIHLVVSCIGFKSDTISLPIAGGVFEHQKIALEEVETLDMIGLIAPVENDELPFESRNELIRLDEEEDEDF